MKNFELINLLNFGNVLVQPPYEDSNLKLKNIIEKTESRILNKFQDSEIRNKFIKQYGELIDSLDFFTYKQINYIFRLKIFKNQDQKNYFFQKIKKISDLYKQFKTINPNKSRRTKRSLFTERQRLTVESWIDKLQDAVNSLRSSSDKNYNNSVAMWATSSSIFLTAGFALLSILTGPIGVAASAAATATLAIGGTTIGITANEGKLSGEQYKDDARKAESLRQERENLKQILIDLKTEDGSSLEAEYYWKIKELVGRVNFIVKDLLDFSSLGFSSNAEQIYLYLLSSGY
ncbi:hypothetical protein EHI52_00180 [Mesomycoplasma hyopneumoniae]|uniref:hypothetical protein n=1 Tax=Mesomycoplasma hyopneumoniae TaxID=2099 RepID=UPI0011B4D7B2|nr:hypothetical protein [Mesomycoplasma hyopneumoniae]MXR10931.1 hypothetical protein [Mesomycoplasma hyopneumoniae]MXR33798.1 hypothetical protein [Mesomycoplasma hyopneumoniae]MXR57443.1 hypothetical protein [Mesomycoplasma hyopneumoniae]MXR63827.1 hypothetical protein [Mesomycoplasma hyopneumoniae]QEA02226.1 hypothetical protein EHI52_00180 [Mesomycoplasma hyopneumoniae]